MSRRGRGRGSRRGPPGSGYYREDPGWMPQPEVDRFDDPDPYMRDNGGIRENNLNRKRPFIYPEACEPGRYTRPRYDELFEPLLPDDQQLIRRRRDEQIELEEKRRRRRILLDEKDLLLARRQHLCNIAQDVGELPSDLVLEQRLREEELLQQILRVEEDLRRHRLRDNELHPRPGMEEDDSHYRQVLREDEFIKQRLLERELLPPRRREEGLLETEHNRSTNQMSPQRPELQGCPSIRHGPPSSTIDRQDAPSISTNYPPRRAKGDHLMPRPDYPAHVAGLPRNDPPLPPGILRDIRPQQPIAYATPQPQLPGDYPTRPQGLPGDYPAPQQSFLRDHPARPPRLPGDHPALGQQGLPGDYPACQQGLPEDHPACQQGLPGDYPVHQQRLSGEYPAYRQRSANYPSKRELQGDNVNPASRPGILKDLRTQKSENFPKPGEGLPGAYPAHRQELPREYPAHKRVSPGDYPENRPGIMRDSTQKPEDYPTPRKYPSQQSMHYQSESTSYLDRHVSLMKDPESNILPKKSSIGNNKALSGPSLYQARLRSLASSHSQLKSSNSPKTFLDPYMTSSDSYKLSKYSYKSLSKSNRQPSNSPKMSFDSETYSRPQAVELSAQGVTGTMYSSDQQDDAYSSYYQQGESKKRMLQGIISLEEHRLRLDELKERKIRTDLLLPLQSLVHAILYSTIELDAASFKNLLSEQKGITPICYFTKHDDPSNRNLSIIMCELYLNNVFMADGQVTMPSIIWDGCLTIGVRSMWSSSEARKRTHNNAHLNALQLLRTTPCHIICNTHKVLRPSQEPEGVFDMIVKGYGPKGNSNMARILLMRITGCPPPISRRVEDIVIMEHEDWKFEDHAFNILNKSASLSGLVLEWDFQLHQVKTYNSSKCTMLLAGERVAEEVGPTREVAKKRTSIAALKKLYKTQPVIRLLSGPPQGSCRRLTWDELQSAAETWTPPKNGTDSAATAAKASADVSMDIDADVDGIDTSLLGEPLLPCNKKVVEYVAHWIEAAGKLDSLQEIWIATGLPLAERRALSKVAKKNGYRIKSETKNSAVFLTAVPDLSPKGMVACLRRNNGSSGRYILVNTGNWQDVS